MQLKKSRQKFARIDIFVNSTGALLFKPIDKFTVENFDWIAVVDLKAAFVTSREALKHMKEGRANCFY